VGTGKQTQKIEHRGKHIIDVSIVDGVPRSSQIGSRRTTEWTRSRRHAAAAASKKAPAQLVWYGPMVGKKCASLAA